MRKSLEILAKAINEYKAEGTELMERLKNKFGYDISDNEHFEK